MVKACREGFDRTQTAALCAKKPIVEDGAGIMGLGSDPADEINETANNSNEDGGVAILSDSQDRVSLFDRPPFWCLDDQPRELLRGRNRNRVLGGGS